MSTILLDLEDRKLLREVRDCLAANTDQNIKLEKQFENLTQAIEHLTVILRSQHGYNIPPHTTISTGTKTFNHRGVEIEK
jgi:hypothetical protein